MIQLFSFRLIRHSLILVFFATFLLLFNGFLSTNTAFGVEQSEDSDQTFLLGEFSIRGNQVEELISTQKKGEPEFPILSTSLRWKDEDRIELDIPKEILKHLTQPDLSRLLKKETGSSEIDLD